jgi:hypothetical protein
LTYDLVKNVVLRKGYRFFTGAYNLNLIGIRGRNRCSDSWDDTFVVLYQDEYLQNKIRIFSEFTTDPGKTWLENIWPGATGSAIAAPGQYRGVWTIGDHTGYTAFVQKAELGSGTITVYRDPNKNDYLNFVNPQTGIYNIDLHHGYGALTVDGNSAGCQVLRFDADLQQVLALGRNQKTYGYGSTFTYTLLTASDIW